MIPRGRLVGAVLGLLLLVVLVSGCAGSAPLPETWPGLTLAGDTLYVISGTPQKVYMVDAETGTAKGAPFVPAGAENGVFYWSPVTVAGNLAFVGFGNATTREGGLYTFDPETGAEQWHVPFDTLILPAPTYADGVVYVGGSDGRLLAVDVESKSVKPGWSFEAGDAIWASPLAHEGRLYVASMDHHIYALDADTGEELWSTNVGAAMAVPPTLDEAGEVLYIGAFDGRVHALRADTGERIEGLDFLAENWIWSEVLVEQDRLYVTSLDGRLYAIEPANGAVIPPYPFDGGSVDDTETLIRAAPIKADDNVVVATAAGRVIAVRDAQQQWSWPPAGATPNAEIYTTPVAGNGRIYVVLMNGNVQTIDASNGVPGWLFESPAAK